MAAICVNYWQDRGHGPLLLYRFHKVVMEYCMPLTADRKKALRTLGHNLKPVVTVAGKGLTEGVMEELNRALEDHELIKVKLMVADRELRHQMIGELCEKSGAELVQEIGKIALIYRVAQKPDPRLSNLLR